MHLIRSVGSAGLCSKRPCSHDGKRIDVKKSEFEYYFNKNRTETEVTRKTVKQYADLYLNFKLKVQAAMDEGLDKSDSFIKEYSIYRNMQAEDYLVDKEFLDSIAHEAYQMTVNDVGSDGLVFLRMIAFIPEDYTDACFLAAQEKAAMVYNKLLDGGDFVELATEYSDDESAAKGGEIGWVMKQQLSDEVAERVFSMDRGAFTEPFDLGGVIVIAKVERRRQIGDFESESAEIYEWINGRTDFPQIARNRRANEYAKRLGWTLRDEEAAAHLDSVLEDVEPEFGNISREYHDGLLLFDISNKEVWEKASLNREGMEEYFNAHKKEFKYSEPAFRGMVFFCTDEDVFNQVKAAVDGVELKNWVDKILPFNNQKVVVRVMRGTSETGIFRQGQNAYVDKIVFGKGEYEPMNNFPYVNVIGNTIDGPESFDDAKSQVVESYQKHLEDEWVNGLKEKYKFKINKRALRKVSLDK